MAALPELQVAIIADDLTGASDSAICFAQAGLTTLVSLDPERCPPADVLAVTTHSRHLPEGEASRLSGKATQQIRRKWGSQSARWTYSKIDSTLRGHPGASLASVMANLGIRRAVVAPAFPDQGRTTVDGLQLVAGQRLACTSFGREVGTSSVAEVLQRSFPEAQVRLIGLEMVRAGVEAIGQAMGDGCPSVFVFDATTEADLVTIARAAVAQNIRLLCGSAGLAGALAKVLPWVPRVLAPRMPAVVGGAVLVVAGSRHPNAVRQVEAARQVGAVTICPEEELLGGLGDGSGGRGVRAAAHQLHVGRDLVLTTAGLQPSPRGAQDVAERLGQITKELVASGQVRGLALTGGDIGMAVCAALECATIWLRGEVEPGIPWGRLLDGIRPGLPVVTKAGGFGTDEALVHAIRHLRQVDG